MAVIEGVAKRYNGTAVDYVQIFNWTDGKCIAQVIPDALGTWSYEYNKKLEVGITYVANGCEPITHGSYTIDYVATGHKWWRVSNITVIGNTWVRTIAELRFINDQLIESNVPAQGFAESDYNASNSSAQAFDSNPSTIAHNKDKATSAEGLLYYIGYEFDEPVMVNAISIQMRQDMQPSFGHEWQTARVEYSDDNITWERFGDINPKLAAMNLNKVVCDIDFSFKLPFRFWRISNIIDRSAGSSYIAAAELYFYDENDINLATDPLKAFSGPNYSDANGVYTPDKAFDGNDSTFSSGQVQGGWFIGYDFGSPKKVVKIGVKGRNDLPAGLGREWQTADIEVSADGIGWKKIGKISPMTTAENVSAVISPIILA